ncbi:hypothetical protein [Rhodococcus yananensis]|uniref:hypothetical protein n=1 Tax=Rhodococcus yananensis TaxID=2879464 RepID=UPI003EBE4051
MSMCTGRETDIVTGSGADAPDVVATLESAAFGSVPGQRAVPCASGPSARWLRAVALGGQGRYAAARAELAEIRGITRGRGVWASLAASTEASLLRQLGGHRAAAVHDGRALAAITEHARHRAGHPGGGHLAVEAEADALTGLAADALGRGRLAQARALLGRCDGLLAGAERAVHGDVFLRQHIRLSWVTAETALAGGDFGTARAFAARAVDDAHRFGSVRHLVKSDLLRAAAATGDSDTLEARERAQDVCERAGEHGLVPLRWAAAMLLTGLDAGPGAVGIRDECAAAVKRGGGVFVPLHG